MLRSLIGGSQADLARLAEVLFATPLQESDHPSPTQVRTAIDQRLRSCHGDVAACAARVAQEAGDHPETYLPRMRWALTTVGAAYRGALSGA